MDSIYINYVSYSTYSTYLIRLGTGERQRVEWNEQRGTPFSTFWLFPILRSMCFFRGKYAHLLQTLEPWMSRRIRFGHSWTFCIPYPALFSFTKVKMSVSVNYWSMLTLVCWDLTATGCEFSCHNNQMKMSAMTPAAKCQIFSFSYAPFPLAQVENFSCFT